MAKDLILYFSRAGENYLGGEIVEIEKGNTEIVAETIADALGGDLFEIKTAEPYSDNYSECVERAKVELRENARPELIDPLEDAEEYDNVFVCGPCWCGSYPMAIYTQLGKLDLSGKNVIPVMTHEGSGLGKNKKMLEEALENANVVDGLAVFGNQAKDLEEDIKKWAKEVKSTLS